LNANSNLNFNLCQFVAVSFYEAGNSESPARFQRGQSPIQRCEFNWHEITSNIFFKHLTP